ncbi:MAG TPA: hypothetical protein VIU46_08085 [Gallionellaceae bacterium]
MRRVSVIACVLLLPGLNALAQVQTQESDIRAELLYMTHCRACHTEQIHWRDNKLATDWSSLQAQVRRWQASAALGWSNDDITAVTRYLNDTFYHFAVPLDSKKMSGK